MGTVFADEDVRPPVECEAAPVWTFKLGLKSQAAAAPRFWAVFSDGEKELDEPEGIIAAPETISAHRLAKARQVLQQVKELLNKAREVSPPDKPVWLMLWWDDIILTATVNWQTDYLATVWVQEQ